MSSTIKRVALVAVAGLFAGSLATTSASAAAVSDSFTGAAASTTTVGTAATTDTVLSFISDSPTAAVTISSTVLSSPLTSSATTVSYAKTTGSTNANTSYASGNSVSPTAAATRTTAAITVSFTPDVAGTYSIKLTVAGGTNNSSLTWTVTANAVGSVTAANSTSYLNTGETTTATSDATVSASKTIANTAQAATIVVTSKNAAGTDLTSSTALTVTISGPGTLGIDTAANVASIAPTGRAITGTAGQNAIGVFSDGSSGVATITVSAGTTVLSTETVTFYGDIAKVVTTVVNSVIPASNTGASVGAVTAVAYDAAGVVVGSGNLYATSDASSIISNSYTSAAITSGKATFTLVGVAVGTANITVGTGSSASATTNITAAPVAIRVGSTTPASVKLSWDDSAYAFGQAAKLSVTLLDSTGQVVPNGTYANIFATGGLVSNFALGSASDAINVTSITTDGSDGNQTFTVYVPAYAATVHVTGTTGTGLPTAAQGVEMQSSDITIANPVADAIDAANEATDAANAATDAANAAAEAADAATAAAQDAQAAVAALATQVASLIAGIKAQITTLTNLVIKIQKKVKA